jgi:hypothetical protein
VCHKHKTELYITKIHAFTEQLNLSANYISKQQGEQPCFTTHERLFSVVHEQQKQPFPKQYHLNISNLTNKRII